MTTTSPPTTAPVDYAERSIEVSRQPAIFNGVPFRNPHFTGRQDALERLHAMLQFGTRQAALLPHALHGMGGVGKSQTVVEYIYQHANEYDIVWWVSAEHPSQITSSLVELAKKMGLPTAATADTAVPAVLDALRRGEEPYLSLIHI